MLRSFGLDCINMQAVRQRNSIPVKELGKSKECKKIPRSRFQFLSAEDILLTVSRLTHSIPYMERRHDDHPNLYMFCAHDLDLSDRGTVLKAAVDIISTAEWHNIKNCHIPLEN